MWQYNIYVSAYNNTKVEEENMRMLGDLPPNKLSSVLRDYGYIEEADAIDDELDQITLEMKSFGGFSWGGIFDKEVPAWKHTAHAFGCIPSIVNNLHEALEKGDICIIINPVKSFAKTDISAIKNYIEKGGSILIMDSIINQESTINELLSHFGMKVIIESKFNGTKNINNRLIGGITIPALKISGGKNILEDEQDQIILSVYETETGGKVVVFVDSYTFSNEIMGSTFTIPNEIQQRLYNTEYYIFEEILLKQ